MESLGKAALKGIPPPLGQFVYLFHSADFGRGAYSLQRRPAGHSAFCKTESVSPSVTGGDSDPERNASSPSST